MQKGPTKRRERREGKVWDGNVKGLTKPWKREIGLLSPSHLSFPSS